MSDLTVRSATLDDLETIVECNSLLASESEEKRLDDATLRAGVEALLRDPQKGRYLLACQSGRVVGQVMVTFEWSDWRNGLIWWLQSVYVRPECRRQGVFRRLFEHVAAEASRDAEVVGLRLYVDHRNQGAQAVYRRMGLDQAGYEVLELLFPA